MSRQPAPSLVVLMTLGKCLLGLAIGVYMAHLLTAGIDEQITDHRPVVQSSTLIPESCWRADEAPGAAIPSHVVWERPSGAVTYSKALTGPALDTLFGDGDLPGRALAFCK